MKRLWSVFTDDMDHCMFTGSAPVERHHIFYSMDGDMKKPCEKYGYIAPLRPDLHPNGTSAGQAAKAIDLKLKQMAQEHYEAHHGSREDFIKEFRKGNL